MTPEAFGACVVFGLWLAAMLWPPDNDPDE